MRTRTRPPFIRLLPALVFGLWLVASCSAERSETELLASARGAYGTAEYPAVIIELKNLLQTNPNNREARILLGQTYLALNNPISAEKEFVSAGRLGANEDDVLPPLSEALLLQGKNEEVVLLQPASELEPQPQSALQTAQAKANLALGNKEAAAALIDSALDLDPTSAEARTTHALIIAMDDPEAGRSLLAEILETNPRHESALVLLGNLERAAHHPQLAESAYSQAIQVNSSGKNYLSRAVVRIELEDYNGAQQDVTNAGELLPNYYEVNFIQGLLHIKAGNPTAAQAALDAAYSANPGFLPTRIFLAEVNFNLGNLAQAEALAAGYLSDNPEYAPASKLYAAILLESGRYAEAESVVGFAIDRMPNDVSLQLILANALRGQGDRQAEIVVLKEIRALDPDNTEIMARLGAAYLALGDEETGTSLMQSALDKNPALLPAAQGLVAYHANRGEHTVAIDIAEGFLTQNPDLPDAYNLAGLAYMSDNDVTKAENSFDTARKRFPGNPAANQNRAAIALRNKDQASARQLYNEVLQYYPDDLQTLVKLALLDQLQGDTAAMVAHLGHAIAKHPKADTPRLLLARYHLANGAPEKVALALNDLLRSDPVSPAVLDITGRAQLVQGEYKSAISTFTRLVHTVPGYSEGYFLLAQAYAAEKDEKRALAQLNKTLEVDPKHLLARLNLAQILYQKEKYDQVVSHLRILNKLAPDNPDILYLEAMLARANEDYEEAQRLFEKISDQVSSTKTLLSLAQQEWDMGDREIAVSRMEQWLGDNSDDLNARLYLAKFYSQSDRPADAISQYKIILQAAGDNLISLNNLAWALRDTAPAEALKYAERARGLAKTSRQVADTYAVVLMKNQAFESALAASDAATTDMEISTGDPTMFFHKAEIMAAMGRNEDAANLLTALLREAKTFPEKPRATELLAELRSQ